jgi:hypothetical protein
LEKAISMGLSGSYISISSFFNVWAFYYSKSNKGYAILSNTDDYFKAWE